MKKRLLSFLLALLMVGTLIPSVASASSRYELINTKGASGADICASARKWAGAGATYWSGINPWLASIYWRTGYTYNGQTSFDCSGFVARVLNDAGFRGKSYAPSYGNCILTEKYGNNFIGISIEDLVNYGTDITSAVQKAKNGDYSELQAGDVIGWTSGSLGRHVIIYAGKNSSGTPTMIEFTGSGYYERSVTSSYQSNFQYGARYAVSTSTSYLNKCTSYASYCTVSTTDSCPLWNIPCSDKTDSSAKKLATINSGVSLTATALYKNTADNYWYKVTYNGTSGYVYAGNTSFVKQLTSDTKISGTEKPSALNVGQAFAIGGTISTSYNQLTYVTGYIFPDGVSHAAANASYRGDSGNLNGNSYSLKSSNVDQGLLFNKLSTGVYYYMVEASVRSYYSTDGTTLKNKISYIDVVDSQFTVGNASHTHSYTLKADDNYSWYQCSCGDTYGKEAHTYGGWSVTKEPNCTETGTQWSKCPVCYHEKTETIAALGHNYGDWTVTKGPSCTATGTKQHTCSRCGKTETASIAALGHSYSEQVVQPNCEEQGYTVHSCTRCGEQYKDSYVNASGHDYLTEIVQPTCEDQGYSTHVCRRCEAQYIDSYTEALGHDYVAGHCSRCDGVDPSRKSGDLNDDGKVTSADAVLLSRYLADIITLDEVQLTASDLNGDGKVTSADAVILARFLAGIIETLP